MAPRKGIEQQGMQSIQRSRQLLVQEQTALSNHLRGLLLEFGVLIPRGFAALTRSIPDIQEDGESELPDDYRPTLARLHERFCLLREDIQFLDKYEPPSWWFFLFKGMAANDCGFNRSTKPKAGIRVSPLFLSFHCIYIL